MVAKDPDPGWSKTAKISAVSAALTALGLGIGLYEYHQGHANDNETVVVNLSPDSVSRGNLFNLVTVNAAGLKGGERARIFFDGQTVRDTTAARGAAFTTIHINPSATVGSHIVNVTGLSSGRHGSETLIVSP